jgi:putative membrane protein
MQKALTQSVAAASAALALAPSAAWTQAPSDAGRYEWGPHMMWWGGGWYAMTFGSLFMILFLAVLVAVAVILVRGLGGPWAGPAPPPHSVTSRTPLDILRDRFARGEIDKEEFEERRRALGE